MSLSTPHIRVFFATLVCLLVSGCVTYMPVEEYNLARAAYDSAKDADALKFAPALWYKAETAYKEGQNFFKERRYDNAGRSFIQAKFLAEKAENSARLAHFQSGEGVPP